MVCYDLRVGLNIFLSDEAFGIDMQPLMPSTRILQWQLGQNLQCKGVVPITTTIEGSKMCLEYHIFHLHGPTFILVGVPLHELLRGTKTSPVELKQLPPGLQYVFPNGDRETLVIISDKRSNDENRRLVATLEKYRLVIGYSLKDLKGISSSLCTHRIPMEQEHKPVREHQRWLNNVMREVVKKEVLKLLEVGVIYPVSDSEWVSSV
jgi:hypothetical protein